MLIILALLSSTAQAAIPSISCPNLEELNQTVQDCQGNGRYGEAGIACMGEFEKLVKIRSEAAKQAMKASNAAVNAAGNKQGQNFEGSGADYKLTQEAIADQILAGEAAKKAVEGYLSNIVFPEDFDAPKEAIGDPVEFLNGEKCYSENRDGLENILDKLDDKLEELQAAKVAATGYESKSKGRSAGVDSISGTAAVSGKAAAGAGTVKEMTGAKPKNGDSTITGVENEKKKQLQKK